MAKDKLKPSSMLNGEVRLVAVARFRMYSLYNGTHFSFRKVNLIVQRDSTQQWGSTTNVIDHKAIPSDSVGSNSLDSSYEEFQ